MCDGSPSTCRRLSSTAGYCAATCAVVITALHVPTGNCRLLRHGMRHGRVLRQALIVLCCCRLLWCCTCGHNLAVKDVPQPHVDSEFGLLAICKGEWASESSRETPQSVSTCNDASTVLTPERSTTTGNTGNTQQRAACDCTYSVCGFDGAGSHIHMQAPSRGHTKQSCKLPGKLLLLVL